MEVTKDGYLIPEENNLEEQDEAIVHNAKLDAIKQKKQTLEQTNKTIAPRGYAKGGLKLDNYMDNVEEFYQTQPFFYDKTGMFWIWNKEKHCYERTDETDIMNLIDQELNFGGQTVTSTIKNNYLEAFRRVGRYHIPEDMPKTWIQFKNKTIDITTSQTQEVTQKYYAVNPIPWNLGNSEETPTIDKLFEDWQGENKHILYEVLAYCLLSDYPIHTIVAMIGSGRNGKSQYQLIIEKLLGNENITSTELDVLIDNRFESAKLYKKLVCSMGETNFNIITKTSLLKKLCGGDLIGYEFKNKMPFTGHNYAKIIINTNSLPPSTDTTEGFYRRWLIINWNNTFKEGKDIINTIPDIEYENLCFKLIPILKELLERGNFKTQGNIEERKNKYILASNPITLFLQERCDLNDSNYIKAKDLYHAYLTYLQENKRRIVKRKEFNQILAEEGFQAEHDKRKVERDGQIEFENSYWIDGLKLKSSFSPFSLFSPSHDLSKSTIRESTELGEIRGVELEKRGKNSELQNILSYDDFEMCILDKPTGWKIEEIICFGFSETQISDWIGEGLIFESPQGTIRLLK